MVFSSLSWHVSSSPFDEALSKPFLGEPVKKRWSLLDRSSRTSVTSTCISDYSESDGDEDGTEFYEAPDLEQDKAAAVSNEGEVAKLGGDHDDLSEEEAAIFHNLQAVDLRAVDADVVILEERNREFGSIRSSMKSISDIQHDLRELVEAQDEDIEDMEQQAQESAEAAARGLRELEETNGKMFDAAGQNTVYLVISALLLVWLLCVYVKVGNPVEGGGVMEP